MNIVFSFDDGRDDAYNAYLVLKKHNLIGSFHVTTGFVDGSFKTDAFGIARRPLSTDQLIEMYKNGMDISSHGDKHILDTKDFQISLAKLRQFGISKTKLGISVPNSRFNDSELNNFVKNNNSSLSYVRVGRSNKCYSLLMKIYYVLYHFFHFQFLFNRFNKNNLLEQVDPYYINSLVMLNDSRSKNLISFINKYKESKLTLVLMFHSIVKNPTNKWEYSLDEFEGICSYVSKNCNVITLEDISKNGKN